MTLRCVLFFLLLSVLNLAKAINITTIRQLDGDEIEQKFQSTFKHYVQSRQISKIGATIDDIYNNFTPDIPEQKVCSICRGIAHDFIATRKSGASKHTMYEYLKQFCYIYGLRSTKTCCGFLDIHIDPILYIIDNGPYISDKWICSVYLPEYHCNTSQDIDWTIDIPRGYGIPRTDTPSPGTFTILHISDIHYDPFYEPGSNSICDEQLCCDSDSNKSAKNFTPAGYWGDLRNCDTPWHAVVDDISHIRQNHNFSYVYYTGDTVHHRAWLTTPEIIRTDIGDIYRLFDDNFRGAKIFPVIGNHDPHPANFFAPPEVPPQFSSQWLFDFFAEQWSKWLPSSTLETIRKGGYYTVKLNDKFRIIVLNSNVCYKGNLWLIYDPKDPYDQLKWFTEILAEAENNGESVHVLGHIPVGDTTCHSTWAREYRKIINRYARTIKAGFNGHTHNSEMEVFYNISDPSQPVHIAFNGGSLTSFIARNPNYFLYEVNRDNMEVVESEQYVYNLTAANLVGPNQRPKWYKLYSFKDIYGLEDMSLSSFDKLITRMASNKSIAQLYYRMKYKNSDPFLSMECNDDCLLRNICNAVTSWYYDQTKCNMMKDIWNKTQS